MGALREFYIDHGFFDVRVGRKLIFSPDQSELQVDFLIEEGPHYIVDHVSFVGNARLTDAELRSVLNLKDGRFYEKETETRDTQEIVRKYSPFGYIYVQNQIRVDEDYLTVHAQRVYLREPGRIELQYTVHEGKSFRLGRIRTRGNDKSQDKLILREFRDLAPGGVYDSAAVQDALERLRALPFFQNVTVTPIGDDPKFRDLLVSVQEQRTASINFGAGVSSNGGLMGNIVYSQTNFDIGNPPDDWRDTFSDHTFSGAGQGLRATFSPGTIYTSADLRFSEPWLFDQPYQFVEDLYLRDAIREAYTDRRIGNEVTFGRRFNHYEDTVAVSLRTELARIYNIEDLRLRAPEILLEGKGDAHASTAVGLSFQHDTTNPGFETYRGETVTAGVESVRSAARRRDTPSSDLPSAPANISRCIPTCSIATPRWRRVSTLGSSPGSRLSSSVSTEVISAACAGSAIAGSAHDRAVITTRSAAIFRSPERWNTAFQSIRRCFAASSSPMPAMWKMTCASA